VIVGPEQASIDELNLETSQRTAKERLCVFIEPRDIEETDNMHRNPKSYNTLL